MKKEFLILGIISLIIGFLFGYSFFYEINQNNDKQVNFSNMLSLTQFPSHSMASDLDFWKENKAEVVRFRIEDNNIELIGWHTCQKEFDKRNYPVNKDSSACLVVQGVEKKFLDCICYYATPN